MVTIDEYSGWKPTERLDLDPTVELAAIPRQPEQEQEPRWLLRRFPARRPSPEVVLPVGEKRRYRPGPITRALLWCGAVDRELLETRIEYYKFSNQGLAVCLVASMAAVGASILLSTVLGGFPVWAVPAVVFWAAVIFAVDRFIVSEPSYRDLSLSKVQRLQARREATTTRQPRSDDDTAAQQQPGAAGGVGGRLGHAAGRVGSKATKTTTYLFRVVLALLIAYLVGEAVLLALFHPEIAKQLDVRHQTAVVAAVSEQVQKLNDENNGPNGYTVQIQAENTAITAAKDNVTTLYTTWQGELKGVGGTGRAGNGAEARDDQRRWTEASNALPGIVQQHTATISGLQKNLTDNQTAINALNSGDPARLPPGSPLRPIFDNIYANLGWVEQESALSDYLASQGDNPTVAAVPWVVRGILLAIDLMPLMLKIAGSATVYGQRMRDRADRIRYRDVIDDEIAMDLIDRGARLARTRSTMHQEVLEQQDRWRRERLIGEDHLRDGEIRL